MNVGENLPPAPQKSFLAEIPLGCLMRALAQDLDLTRGQLRRLANSLFDCLQPVIGKQDAKILQIYSGFSGDDGHQTGTYSIYH